MTTTTMEGNDKNPNAVALGRLGGLKGGKARAAKLSKSRRTEIAKMAAAKRWNKEYKFKVVFEVLFQYARVNNRQKQVIKKPETLEGKIEYWKEMAKNYPNTKITLWSDGKIIYSHPDNTSNRPDGE